MNLTDDKAPEPALVTDLDGSLIKTDSLWEGFFAMMASRPLALIQLLLICFKGRIAIKKYLAEYSLRHSERFPLNENVLKEIEFARASGRDVYLATAAYETVARKVSQNLGLFKGVFATTDEVNLKGQAKADALKKFFGEQGFDYIGDSKSDLQVWAAAREAIVVSADERLIRAAENVNGKCRVIASEKPSAKIYLKAVRLHQWVKNFLIAVPLITSHSFDLKSVFLFAAAFAAFSCCTSTVYILNDLFDLSSDRCHPNKKKRPFANGSLPLKNGAAIFIFAFIMMCTLSLFLPANFALTLLGYYIATFAYSLWLKKCLMLDTITLSCFYIVRVLAGAVALELTPSSWLIGFCFFIFLALALVKRVSEITLKKESGIQNIQGRAYLLADLNILETMSICCGFCSAAVLALYIDSLAASALYSNPHYLWIALPIFIYWFGRLLLLNSRHEVGDDPVAFIVADKASYVCAAVGFLSILLAI